MDVIKSGWEDDFYEGKGPVDEVFLKRLDFLFKLDKTGLMERIKTDDLWNIIRTTVAAYIVRIDDDPPEKYKPSLFMGIPIDGKNEVVKAIFNFQQWLQRHISPAQEENYRRIIPAAISKADNSLKTAAKTNDPLHVAEAEKIWSVILELKEN